MLLDVDKSSEYMKIIETQNKIKTMLYNSANEDKKIDLYILNGLLHEIKINI